jgi:hypothetical protein
VTSLELALQVLFVVEMVLAAAAVAILQHIPYQRRKLRIFAF